MRVEFLAENLQSFIPILSKIIPLHSPVPILSNVLIVVTRTYVSFSSTNLELGVSIQIPAKIEEEGSTTVPGKQFLEVLSSIGKGKVTLTQEGETVHLFSGESIKNSANKISFQTITREEFPSLYEDKGEKVYTFQMAEFKDIFSKLAFVVSLDDSRPQLTGIFMVQKEGYIDFVATDGFRLALKRVKGKKIFELEGGIIISAKLINEALSIKENERIDMYMHHEANQVLFENGNITLVGRSIAGDFPNYERVIPVAHKTKITFDSDEFLQAIRLSLVFAKESANIVKLVTEDGVMRLLSKSSGVGEGDITVEVMREGEDNEIAFNAKFLIDLLRATEEKRLILELNSPVEPALFKGEKNEDSFHVIMPVRVQE